MLFRADPIAVHAAADVGQSSPPVRLQAVVDGRMSATVQTLNRQQAPELHDLLFSTSVARTCQDWCTARSSRRAARWPSPTICHADRILFRD